MSEHAVAPDPDPADDAGPEAAALDLGRAALLVAGPAVIAVFWWFGALPAWGAAALGAIMSVLAVVVLLRSRVIRGAPGDAEGARVLVVGGGYAGLVAARALQARLPGGARGGRHLGAAGSSGIARITVVDPQPHMTYQPFLPEAAAGAVEPATSRCRCAGRCGAATSSPGRWRRSTTRSGAPW